MSSKHSVAAAAIYMFCVVLDAGAAMPDWQPIGQPIDQPNPGTVEKFEIDRSRIGAEGNGMVTVWSRLNANQAVTDKEGRYNVIEALNRYDCSAKRFSTLKRLYLADNTLIRAERVLAPRQLDIVAGGIEAVILSDVCGPETKPLPLAKEEAPRVIVIADSGHGAAANLPTASKDGAVPAPRRFISLPAIDPSQIQHPTDEPKPAEPATKQLDKQLSRSTAPAIKTEAAKAGVSLESGLRGQSRHSRELALATSGPRKSKPLADQEDNPPPVLQHHDIHWDYEGEGAPANWAKLRADYGQCASGQRQSPIDIREGIRVDLEPIQFNYRPSLFRIVDNGHTVQVSFGEGNDITVMGRRYSLVQLHFHRPSEERIEGRGFDMVVHLVHKDEEGRLAVVAVLLERGPEHPVIQTFWNNLPLETNTELTPASAIDPNKLLPETRTYYTYMGSLTTPPCSEGVLWMVLKQPVQLSAEQVAIFARLYPNNARPVQSGNGRLIKGSR